MKIDFNNSTTLRVRYSETDQMGYCYYGNYAQYFEVGRVEALRSIGMSYKSLEDRGIMLPVSDFQVTYKTPAKYDDQLTIQTKIIELKGGLHDLESNYRPTLYAFYHNDDKLKHYLV